MVCIFNFSLSLFLGLSAATLTSLIQQHVRSLSDIGMTVTSLVMDGLASNKSSLKEMGLHLSADITDSKVTIDGNPVNVLIDACHCLKLARNTLAATDISSPDGIISWGYIRKLVDIQEREGLRLGNRLTRRHIDFQNEKMKVSLAAHILSRSASESLVYLRQSGNPEFRDSKATEKFVLVIDEIFDLLNSRTTRSKDPLKKPLSVYNIIEKEARCEYLISYLKALCLPNGQKLSHSLKQTFVIGFIICLRSSIAIFKRINSSFLCTYRLSQDHIELFFNSLRRFGGCNNNPSSLNIKAAMRSILCRAGVAPGKNGNVIPLDETPVEIPDPDDIDDISLSIITEDILQYIAGWVARKVASIIQCETCTSCLKSNERPSDKSLLTVKMRGKLVVPSADMLKAVLWIERGVRQNLTYGKLRSMFLEKFGLIGCLFYYEYDHFIDTTQQIDSHYYQLLSSVFETFFTLRLHQRAKIININNVKKSIRKKLSKVVLFNNQ